MNSASPRLSFFNCISAQLFTTKAHFLFTAKAQRTQSINSANSASPQLTFILPQWRMYFHRKGAKSAKHQLCELCVSAVNFFSLYQGTTFYRNGAFSFHRKGAKNAKHKLFELCVSADIIFFQRNGVCIFTAKAQRTRSINSANSASPRLSFFHGSVIVYFHRKGAKNAKHELCVSAVSFFLLHFLLQRRTFFLPQRRKEREA